jgi:hypothetical protein
MDVIGRGSCATTFDRTGRVMPGRIRVLGWCFILAGALSALGAARGLVDQSVQIGDVLGIFLIPVGFGLFQGKRTSRRWATGWLIYAAFGSVSLTVVGSFRPALVQASIFGNIYRGAAALPYIYVIAPILTLACLVLLWLLFSQPSKAFIELQELTRRVKVSARPAGVDPNTGDV